MWKSDLGYVDLTGQPDPPGDAWRPEIGPTAKGILLWWGVIIPLVALVIESNFHPCARWFFDPFPSRWHVYLFSLIPASNLLAWLSFRVNLQSMYGVILFANGLALGVAILYSLMFLPLLPASCLAILYLGIGLLGLAPILSLVSLWKGGNLITRATEHMGSYFNPHQVHHLGHIIVLLSIVAVELPSSFTRVALAMASEPGSQKQGLDLLRAFGSQEVLLRACYERSGRATDIVGSLYESHHPMPVETARRIFYQVTGRTFNSFPIPESARATMQHIGAIADDGAPDDEFDLDPDIAGEMVSGVSRGLTVKESTITASIDADAAVSTVDWIMAFSNKSKFDREVRTRVSLPPGGVVNKAALVVDGKEYEAEILVKQEARRVYRQAVADKRNPLLVSTCGPDTVLIQCFPVPPKNTRDVRLHLGIVAPVGLDPNKQGVFVMPQFEERNFQLEIPHRISITSPRPLSATWAGLQLRRQGQKHVLTGDIDSKMLAAGGGMVRVSRNPTADIFVANDRLQWDGGTAVALPVTELVSSCRAEATPPGCALRTTECSLAQSGPVSPLSTYSQAGRVTELIMQEDAETPRALELVLDGSACMQEHLPGIARALRKLPPGMPVQVWFVTDEDFVGSHHSHHRQVRTAVRHIQPKSTIAGSPDFSAYLNELSRMPCAGGRIDAPAVYRALQDARFHHGAILWIHGAQPYPEKPLSLRRRTKKPAFTLYDMQVSSGPNQALDQLEATPVIRKVFRSGTVEQDLALLFDQWSHKVKVVSAMLNHGSGWVRPLGSCGAVTPEGDYRAMPADNTCEAAIPQLAQLWANQEILKACQSGSYFDRQRALSLAARYHIVTPMSSAILVMDIPELPCTAPEEVPGRDPFAVFWAGAEGFKESVSNALRLDLALSRSFSSVVGQLNRLNSYQEQSMTYQGSPQDSFRNYAARSGQSSGSPTFGQSPPSSGLKPGYAGGLDQLAQNRPFEIEMPSPSQMAKDSRMKSRLASEPASGSIGLVDSITAPTPRPVPRAEVRYRHAHRESTTLDKEGNQNEFDKGYPAPNRQAPQGAPASTPLSISSAKPQVLDFKDESGERGASPGSAPENLAQRNEPRTPSEESLPLEGKSDDSMVVPSSIDAEEKPSPKGVGLLNLFAKPVPESDSYWLILAAAIMLAIFFWRSSLSVKKA